MLGGAVHSRRRTAGRSSKIRSWRSSWFVWAQTVRRVQRWQRCACSVATACSTTPASTTFPPAMASSTPSVLILQHADWELPGCYDEVLAERGARTLVVRPDQGEPLPSWQSCDAILAMGGPMS